AREVEDPERALPRIRDVRARRIEPRIERGRRDVERPQLTRGEIHEAETSAEDEDRRARVLIDRERGNARVRFADPLPAIELLLCEMRLRLTRLPVRVEHEPLRSGVQIERPQAR